MNTSKSTILVVDAIPEQIEQLSTSLVDHHEVIVATNGPDALELAEKEAPDLIFLDVAMPGMDVQEICNRLKSGQSRTNTPLVLLVSSKQAENDEYGEVAGANDCIDRSLLRPTMVRARVRMHLTYKHRLDHMEQLVITDELTKVSNRRHFEETLDREWRRTVREKMGLSIILADIDHFKQYNDIYGHTGGDDCLRLVAQAMRKPLRRPGDFLARIGGEEFATVLFHMDPQGTESLAREMRQHVESLRIPHSGSSSAEFVTISVGYATMTPSRGSSPQPLLEAADQMLYRSKSSGRNQVRGILL